ncbi:dynein light chain type 1 domain-containing protein [Ditylenchus destructor]|nr:dynein light chain type 1 domain-containing protein [Ditylenchus destructor]
MASRQLDTALTQVITSLNGSMNALQNCRKMNNEQVLVITNDMKRVATDLAHNATKMFKKEFEVAKHIQSELTSRYGPSWIVLVGKDMSGAFADIPSTPNFFIGSGAKNVVVIRAR